MARTQYWMNVSLDLFIARDDSEEGGGSWMRIGEQLHREFNRRARGLALSFEGRVIYEIMEKYWPGARGDESLPEYLRDYGEIWTSAPKVLVSNTRKQASHNTRIVGGDGVIAELAELRGSTKGTIGVGGANLATQLLEHDLLDELLLFTHPVVLGSGRRLFDRVDAPIDCDLLERAEFDDGVTMYRYAIRPAAR